MTHAAAVPALRREGRERLERAGVPDPLREADGLLAHVLGVDRVRLLVDPPAADDAVAGAYRRLIDARARRVPAAYLTGRAEFRSRVFEVGPAVLVPRPETEHLVEAALARLPERGPVRVVDVGTGSGCIAVSLALERPRAVVVAVDRSAPALATAVRNARSLGAADRVRFVRGDLLGAVRGPVDMVVSNPPYVAERDAVDPEVLHEPREALFAGADGMDAYRRLVPDAARVLCPGGVLLLETPGAGVEAMADLCRSAGLVPEPPLPDLAGRPRVLGARAP